MRTTVFNFELRIALCQECGAPVEVGEAGGARSCSYCGSAPTATSEARPVARSGSMAEPERLRVLAGQLGQPAARSSDLQDLFVGERLLPWKVSEALGRWRGLRERVEARSGDDEQSSFVQLTRALASHFGDEGDEMRERALLQAALDVTTSARHRQSLLAALARAAVGVGDPAAAESWLGLCDPASTDLEADSAYRSSRALVHCYGGRHQAVLETLGTTSEEIPIASEYRAGCAVLRAHALENLGRQQEAVAELVRAGPSPLERHRLREFRRLHGELRLCPNTAPAAETLQAERGAGTIARAAGRPGIILAFTVGVLIAGGITTGILATTGVHGGALMAAGIAGLMLKAFIPLTFTEFGRSRRARHLSIRGLPLLASVVHARYTGQTTMGVPQLLYKLLVFPDGAAPFYAHSVLHADQQLRDRMRRGALAIVRMDPDQRGDVLLELD